MKYILEGEPLDSSIYPNIRRISLTVVFIIITLLLLQLSSLFLVPIRGVQSMYDSVIDTF